MEISTPSILFGLFGLFITGSILWKSNNDFFVKRNLSYQNFLLRIKRKNKYPLKTKKLLGLKNEFRSGIILMGMLNVLLFVVNLTDIRYVWFGFEEQSAYQLSKFVHEGTWVLIVALLLAMSVILFYFRGNLNFFSKNKRKKHN